MYIPFNEIADSSRIWIYQSDRLFTNGELNIVNQKLSDFTSNWSAHQVQLQSSFVVLENLFVVLVVNEAVSKASGCSIDSSVAVIKDIENQLSVSLFDRTKIVVEDFAEVKVLNISNFKAILHPNLLVFNNLVSVKGDLNTKFKVAVKDSWHSKYLR